jgi:hypothetical protein
MSVYGFKKEAFRNRFLQILCACSPTLTVFLYVPVAPIPLGRAVSVWNPVVTVSPPGVTQN